MPCRDYYDDNPAAYYGPKLADKDAEIAKLQKQISFAESALCQTLAALERVITESPAHSGNFYDWIDYKEAGIARKDLTTWHKKHKELDEKHRAEEAARIAAAAAKKKAEQKAARARATALAKLTPAERKLLKVA